MKQQIFPPGKAYTYLLKLREETTSTQTLAPGFDASYLFKRLGQMFGILVCRTQTGEEIVLKAFSGMADGTWKVKGYVPPCFSVTLFDEITAEYDPLLHCYADRVSRGEEALAPTMRALSSECLQKLYALYRFHDIDGKEFTFKDLGLASFPTGTGDCCGPKLLNYAFKKGYHPISLCEMFIGVSKTRVDGECYPPCLERCHLILPHMLKLDILYADEDIIVVVKPEGVLSVPGRGEDKYDSISTRTHTLFPSSPSLPSVHRLDMDTSGILVLAMNEESKRNLSMQFEARKTEKTYEALVEGVVMESEGDIDLPIRLDIDNRPYQIVDQVQGKAAFTHYTRMDVEWLEGRKVTRLCLQPRTGRTHQLRVHMASGLQHPIVGDRLYGERKDGERLMLHAFSLAFYHPRTGEKLIFTAPTPF